MRAGNQPSADTKRPCAVVLVSGGMDSATCLALAKEQGFDCYALSFDYGQRHGVELNAARQVVASIGVREHRVIHLDLAQFGGSALTDTGIDVPADPSEEIPITYVPARNTVFLALALAWSEVLGADDIFIGVNAVDYSGYPDCRPEYISAFQQMAGLATKAGVEGRPVRLNAPLIQFSKSQIIREGRRLGVDFSLTVSCYQADLGGGACGICDACRFRIEGFRESHLPDPTRYSR